MILMLYNTVDFTSIPDCKHFLRANVSELELRDWRLDSSQYPSALDSAWYWACHRAAGAPATIRSTIWHDQGGMPVLGPTNCY